jgi:superfamily I DNA/RNA helicase
MENSRKACLEEERRLFFVGMSRPHKTLTILYPRKDREKQENFRRSIFINDIAEAGLAELWEINDPAAGVTRVAEAVEDLSPKGLQQKQ